MKKLIFFFVYLFPITVPAQKLSNKFSFYVQGGYMSSLYVKEAGQKEIISETETRHHKCIILNAGFQVNLSKKWKIGLAFTYDHFGTKHRSMEFSTLSYLLRCDITWKETRKYTLYSGLSLGVRKIRRFENEVEIERKVNPGYQIYLMGANYKITDRLFFDVNAGWGVSGILNAGLKYRL